MIELTYKIEGVKMKIFKSRIFAFLLGGIFFSSIAVYATVQIQASNIGYNEGTVQDALDDLYRVKGTGVQVATLTTPGGTYTMQNDGYIVGTASAEGQSLPCIYYNEDERPLSSPGNTSNVSLFAPKGTVIKTRENVGVYNLTVYEWK